MPSAEHHPTSVRVVARLEQLDSFLQRYRSFTRQRERSRFETFSSGFARLATGLADIRRRAAEVERRTAPRFNIFRVLDRERREVTTHSRFLAHLLDPTACHGQGGLFLEKFLRSPPIELGETASMAAIWYVQPEKVTSFGNIDLVISCPRLRSCVVIENKIYAGDQPGQLARYYTWLKRHSLYELARSRLIYLTPGGGEPSSDSPTYTLDGEVFGEARDYVHCMSYRRHIRDWLTECLDHLEADVIAGVLRQYLASIDAL